MGCESLHNQCGRVTRKKVDDISHFDYFIVYAATTGVILYWKIYQPFVIHSDHHILFDENNSSTSI